ncbi:hypothetical protein N7517_009293 [Penicillium concentricum]|uniref:Heterokaryon incompatibility domain-containing protein n=1 Tax=Penicillium concentricum TaxID=293559 RepID=A0A9W9UWM0_9EURO|nr:uncharacterized protein N7517_009293 [Penicillium concentricum]KAJ5360102.1 hypothetical protein N7517_009293 [Penicillium concentricum]
MSLYSTDTRPILQAVHTATEDLGFCRNRVWAIAKSLPGGAGQFPRLLPPPENLSYKAKRDDHELCTFDFCEQSRVNFTLVKQRHETSCVANRCPPTEFPSQFVADAVRKDQPTVWDFEGTKTLQRNERYMAISHVWSDGTGAGNQPPGHVNTCLLQFFRGFAQKFDCKGIWWDTICIPTKKDLREKALKSMQQTYTAAAVTLVHDCFLRDCEWRDADSACFYIVMSPWFSRGWTALELKMSQKVQVIFNSPSGPITKDLDEDILKSESNNCISPEHEVAKAILRRLRGDRVGQLNDLLAILGSRHTSWPRDMAIISGLMIGIELPETYAHQKIYQEILQKLGKISHAHLFHNSATMTNGYNWCPTNLYDLPVTLSSHTLQIEENGNLFGEWNIMSLDLIKDESFVWGRAHPLIEAKVLLARQEINNHILLIEPGFTSEETRISRGLLVKPSLRRDETYLDCYCDYVGPVYFHPPLMRSEIENLDQSLSFKIHVGYDETIHNGSHQSTENEDSAQSMIKDMKDGSPNPQYRKRESGLGFDLAAWDQSKIWEEFKKAAASGDYEKVENLLEKVVNPDNTDQSGWSALHHAVWNGRTKVVKLLAKRLSLQKASAFGEEPLHLAAERAKRWVECLTPSGGGGFSEIVDEILQEKWEINATTDVEEQTALHMASSRGHEGVVHVLAKHDADHALKDYEHKTAFSLAVFNGHQKIAEMLRAAGADPDLRDEKGWTMLHHAVQEDQYTIIKLLCALRVDLEVRTEFGWTPLHQAVSSGRLSAVKLLAAEGAYLEARDKQSQTPLHRAAYDGHVGSIEILAGFKADLEARDDSSQTPLHRAAANGHPTVIERLAELGANLEARDEFGDTPLHRAAANGHVTSIKTLADLRADLEAADESGQTPFHRAAYNGHPTVIEILSELGANLEARDDFSQTPFHRASFNGHAAVIETLVDLGANLEARDEFGRTPFHQAAIKGHVTAIKLLAARGANLEAQDTDGQTPLHHAELSRHDSAVKILSDLIARSQQVERP